MFYKPRGPPALGSYSGRGQQEEFRFWIPNTMNTSDVGAGVGVLSQIRKNSDLQESLLFSNLDSSGSPVKSGNDTESPSNQVGAEIGPDKVHSSPWAF